MQLSINFHDLYNFDYSSSKAPHSKEEVFERVVNASKLEEGPLEIHITLPDDASYVLRHLVQDYQAFVDYVYSRLINAGLHKVTTENGTQINMPFYREDNKLKMKVSSVCIDFDRKYPDDSQVRYELNQEQLNQLRELEKVVNSEKGKLSFGEVFDDSLTSSYRWSLDDLIKANQSIDFLAETINKNNLTPFEALVFVENWVLLNLTYSKLIVGVSERDFYECTNTIVSAFNGLTIRCVGASQLVNAVFHKTNFEIDELYCQTAGIFWEKLEDGGHSFNLIGIRDDKYNIEGFGILDATPLSEEQIPDNFANMFSVNGALNKEYVMQASFRSISSTLKCYSEIGNKAYFIKNKQTGKSNIDRADVQSPLFKVSSKLFSSSLVGQLKSDEVKDENIQEHYRHAFETVAPLLYQTMLKKDEDKTLE